MRFDILTLFPDMVNAVLSESIIGRAVEKGCVEIYEHNIRDYTENKHRRVDDAPYGGGMGMIMQVQPIISCYNEICKSLPEKPYVIYMSPQGKVFKQYKVNRLKKHKYIMIICGHYEGIDQRVIDLIVDEEISMGDYVLTGGEIPACALVDAITRTLPDVLPDSVCFEEESIYNGILEHPQYTRPPLYMGLSVPDVLQSGHHKNIEKWKREEALKATAKKRPDLLRRKKFTNTELNIINKIKRDGK